MDFKLWDDIVGEIEVGWFVEIVDVGVYIVLFVIIVGDKDIVWFDIMDFKVVRDEFMM